jgi:hypothetical protein
MFYQMQKNPTYGYDVILIATGVKVRFFENFDFAVRQVAVMNYHAKKRGYANP